MAAAVQERFDAVELANPPERVPITRPSAREPGAALAVAALGFFVVTLDALVVNVALPAIGHELGGGITGLQWVIDGYTLMFAALLLSAGALSDRIGARQAYGMGLALFVAAWRPRSACWSWRGSPREPAQRSCCQPRWP